MRTLVKLLSKLKRKSSGISLWVVSRNKSKNKSTSLEWLFDDKHDDVEQIVWRRRSSNIFYTKKNTSINRHKCFLFFA